MNAASTRPVVASVTVEAPTSVVVVVNVRGDVCAVLKDGVERQGTRLMEPGEFLLRYTLADSPAITVPTPKPTAALRGELAQTIGKSPPKAQTKASAAAEVGPEQARPTKEAPIRLGTIERRRRIIEWLRKEAPRSCPEIARALGLKPADVAYDLSVLIAVDGKVDPHRAPLVRSVGENGYQYQVRR